MEDKVQKYNAVLALVSVALASGAFAQSTSTTMDMGGGMTHVDSMGPNGAMSSSNCMNMGGGMSSCQTMDMSQSQRTYHTPDMSHPRTAGGNTISVIAGLIARSNERSFQKKVGALLAQGDCGGVAKMAFDKGRLELGNQINAACSQRQSAIALQPSTVNSTANGLGASPLTATAPELENRLQLAAAKANAATPTPLDNITTATKVEAIGTQILITAKVNASSAVLTDAVRSSVTNQICANMTSPDLLRAGASIRIKYFGQNGQDIGSVMVTRTECGV